MTSRQPLAGRSYPLGATPLAGGVNFCVFSKNATAVDLLLFDHPEDDKPARVLPLEGDKHRTFYYWHAFVPHLRPGQLYGYRAEGPFAPEQGLRFDGTKILLDPYARAVLGGPVQAAHVPPGTAPMKGVVIDSRAYDWEGDAPLQRPLADAVIYEMHVAGFTKNPNSGVAEGRRGTYAGFIERIPHLKDLGVTMVELLPIQQFNPFGLPSGRVDYWGYNPVALFAPHRGYSARTDPLGPVEEFCDLVKALHRAGIEVILDVVFNHTGEGDHTGPTFSFRGLENRAYYLFEQGTGRYANYSGCGNTLNGNHSIVRRLIIDCLHYWVQVMHVDGFRFDLASVLSRDENGHPLENPPILWEIESDPVLAGCKIIAEAWDAAGLYQVGRFIGNRWAEWNGQFRDDVRRFVRGDGETVPRLAARVLGSPDLYPLPDRDPHRSINFVTCHDGFTLHDLVSYNGKHNAANGEENRDGANDNYGWNCGAEGPTAARDVLALRGRQMKNLLTVLLLSQGTPMLLMGDEGGRTQGGNNNAYCQDNPMSWMDWDRLAEYEDLGRFTRALIGFRRRHPAYRMNHIWTNGAAGRVAQLLWHGVRCFQPDWGAASHTLAFALRCRDGGEPLYVALNAFWEPLSFELPELPTGERWHRFVDTALAPPDDVAEPGQEPAVTGLAYPVAPRSAVVLVARRDG